MTAREKSERELREYNQVTATRDNRIIRALLAGMDKMEIHKESGLSRVTIDRTLANLNLQISVRKRDHDASEGQDQAAYGPEIARFDATWEDYAKFTQLYTPGHYLVHDGTGLPLYSVHEVEITLWNPTPDGKWAPNHEWIVTKAEVGYITLPGEHLVAGERTEDNSPHGL